MALRTTSHDSDWQPQYATLVMVLFCALYTIGLTLMTKLFVVFGVPVVAAVLATSLCAVVADVTTEVYGFNRMRVAIWLSVVCGILFTLLTQMAVQLPPAPQWRFQDAYVRLFATSARMVLALHLAWVVGQFVNSLIVSKLKLRHRTAQPALAYQAGRFIASSAVAQLVDCVIFFGVGLAGVMPFKMLIISLFGAWLIRLLAEIVLLPVSLGATRWLKRLEGIEHYDQQALKLV